MIGVWAEQENQRKVTDCRRWVREKWVYMFNFELLRFLDFNFNYHLSWNILNWTNKELVRKGTVLSLELERVLSETLCCQLGFDSLTQKIQPASSAESLTPINMLYILPLYYHPINSHTTFQSPPIPPYPSILSVLWKLWENYVLPP
jgi:hypothetical protein